MDLVDKIKEEVKKLLSEKKVDVIIGYRKGTLPFRSTPAFIQDIGNVDSLIFDPTCSNNLASFVKKLEGKAGVIAKGCDGRSLISLVIDKQLSRDNLLIIGVPCDGVIDQRKVSCRLDGYRITDYSLSEDKITVRGEGFEQELKISEVLSDSCKDCEYQAPPVYDILIGQEVRGKAKPSEELLSFKGKSQEERWRLFEEEFSRCIRCYACREVCPACFCEHCLVDRTKPLWFGKTLDLSDTISFHLIRAYHTAGRCVDCGACARACPMGINFRLLTKRLEEEVKERFGFQAGVSIDELPPLSVYREEDLQEFIL